MVEVFGRVLFIYVLISICIVFFDCLFLFNSKHKDRKYQVKREIYKTFVDRQTALLAQGEPVDEKIQQQLYHDLKHVEQLMFFGDVLKVCKEQQESQVSAYLVASLELLHALIRVYQKKESMYQAAFANFLATCGVKSALINAFLLACVTDKSMYKRENALQALYCLGDPHTIIIAFKRMAHRGMQHNSKLLTDGLLSIIGEQKLLSELLWENFSQFALSEQIAIIDYWRFSANAGYTNVLEQLLSAETTEDELCYAIIRYFGKIHHEPVEKQLLAFLTQPRRNQWEYAAIAAAALKNYANGETVVALKQALRDSNWHVRFNAAESLMVLGLPEGELEEIWQGDDPFAKDILLYCKQHQQLKQEIGIHHSPKRGEAFGIS